MEKHLLAVLLGARIKRHRLQADISQQALADRCGVYRTYLGQIEAGLANPTLQILVNIAQALDVPLATLLSRATQGEE